MGVIIGSAVLPIAFSITWRRCSAAGAILGSAGGLVCAIIAWVLVATGLTGKVTIDTLGGDYPMLAGNLVAIFMGGIICVIVSLIKPQDYNWADMAEIPLGGCRVAARGVAAPWTGGVRSATAWRAHPAALQDGAEAALACPRKNGTFGLRGRSFVSVGAALLTNLPNPSPIRVITHPRPPLFPNPCSGGRPQRVPGRRRGLARGAGQGCQVVSRGLDGWVATKVGF